MTHIPPLIGSAPISQRLRNQLERDARTVESVRAAAERKGLDTWGIDDEYRTARNHFELGCWLAHYAGRVGKEADPQVRIDCVRRLWESDITSPGYRFFTIFGFGEREFDTCFEMGDGDKVAAALKALAKEDPTGPIAAGVKAFRWEMREPADAAADTLERVGAKLVIPDSHVFYFDRAKESSWNGGSPGSYMTAHLRSKPDVGDAIIEGDIRVFLDKPRAFISAYETNGWAGKREPLLHGADVEVHADDYDGLVDAICARYSAVLNRHAAQSELEPVVANASGPAPTVYIESYACSDHGPGPAFAIVDADDAFRRQLLNLQSICKEHGLSEARVNLGCDWGPGEVETDLRLENHELVVAGDMFWFVAQPKHADYHVETRLQSIESFVKDTAAHAEGTPLRFGEYDEEDWEEYLEETSQPGAKP